MRGAGHVGDGMFNSSAPKIIGRSS